MTNQEIVETIVAIFNSGDTSAVAAIFASEYIDHQKPPFINVQGSGEFSRIVELSRTSMPNLKVTIEDIISENNKIAARLHWHSEDSNGTVIERESIEILYVTNGLITEHWGAEA